MKPEHDAFYKDMLASLRAGTLAIFAGAGMSMKSGFVDWQGLLKEITGDLGGVFKPGTNLAALAQEHINQVGGRSVVNEKILNVFERNASLSETHRILAQLNIDTFWTTNYDSLIEKCLSASKRTVDVKHAVNQLPQHLEARDSVLYKMHGDRLTPHSAILTFEDYAHYADTHGAFLDALSTALTQKRFLFIGISFEDQNLEWVFNRLNSHFGDAQRHHWYFTKRDTESPERSEAFAEKLKRYSLQPVWIDSFEEILVILEEIDLSLVRAEFRDATAAENNAARVQALGILAVRFPFHKLLLSRVAYELAHLGQPVLARSLMERVLELDPDDAHMLSSLGGILHNSFREYELAVTYLKRAVVIEDEYEPAHTNLGNNYLRLKKYRDARYHFERALEIDRLCGSAHSGMAECMEKTSEFENARTHYQKALDIDPEDVVALNNLAKLSHLEFRDFDQARKYYEQAIAVKNDNATLHLNYGMLLLTGFHDPKAARMHFNKAIQSDAKDSNGPLYMAMALSKAKKDPELVIDHLNNALALNPEAAIIHRKLGEEQYNENKENWPAALACIQQAIALDPSDGEAWHDLGTIQLLKLSAYTDAAGSFEKAIACGFKDYSCFLNLGMLYHYKLGRPDRAKLLYSTSTELFSDREGPYLQLGILAETENTYDIAVQNYRLAVDAGENLLQVGERADFLAGAYSRLASSLSNYIGDHAAAKIAVETSIAYEADALEYFSYGIILDRLGLAQDALVAFERSLQFDPGYYKSRWNIASILYTKGDYTLALQWLEPALAAKVDDESYTQLAARIYYDLGMSLAETDLLETERRLVLAMKFNPVFAAPFMILAQQLHDAGKLEISLSYLALALKHEEPRADVWEVMGMRLSEEFNRKKEAIPFFEHAITLRESYHAYFNLALTCDQLGLYEKALPYYEKALALKPDHEKAPGLLAELRQKIKRRGK